MSTPASSRRLAVTLTLGVAIVMSVVSGCGAGTRNTASASPVPLPAPIGTSQQISRDNLTHLWPLTVDHGTIECRANDQAVFIAPDGNTYALNDKAKTNGAENIELIRAAGADHSPISLGALRTKALALCSMNTDHPRTDSAATSK